MGYVQPKPEKDYMKRQNRTQENISGSMPDRANLFDNGIYGERVRIAMRALYGEKSFESSLKAAENHLAERGFKTSGFARGHVREDGAIDLLAYRLTKTPEENYAKGNFPEGDYADENYALLRENDDDPSRRERREVYPGKGLPERRFPDPYFTPPAPVGDPEQEKENIPRN